LRDTPGLNALARETLRAVFLDMQAQ